MSKERLKAKKKILIPRGGLPVWNPAVEPDSPFHARLRIAISIFAALIYCVLIGASMMGWAGLAWFNGLVVACFGVLVIPFIHYSIRPGTGRTWLITLVLLPLIIIAPYVMVPFTLCLVGVQFVRSMRGANKRGEA